MEMVRVLDFVDERGAECRLWDEDSCWLKKL